MVEERVVPNGSAVLGNGKRWLYVYYPGVMAWVKVSTPYRYMDRDYIPTLASLRRLHRLFTSVGEVLR